jgi:hypothetical protein
MEKRFAAQRRVNDIACYSCLVNDIAFDRDRAQTNEPNNVNQMGSISFQRRILAMFPLPCALRGHPRDQRLLQFYLLY